MRETGLALLTDLYELTMMQGYFFEKKRINAVFDMFFRRSPFGGGYAVFAGLQPLLEEVRDLRFTGEELDYLAGLGMFRPEFLDYLAGFRFAGDIYAVDEGTAVFPNEPLLRVEGDIIQAQLLESLLLNIVNFQTLIATKTSRVFLAANGGSILEFGLRRAQGINGALAAARAAHIGGASATSNVLAGHLFGIPVAGTMAHSWIMAFPDEREAFMKFALLYPDRCVLLVDTYDTLKSGVPHAVSVFREMMEKGPLAAGVRLDSGDLEYLSKKVRKAFDDAGLPGVRIYASNELDEHIISHLVRQKAPIDAWGVGTHLVTAKDDPSLSGVYKLVAREQEGRMVPTIKISNAVEKATNPCRKNIVRFFDERNVMMADVMVREEEGDPDPLLGKLPGKEPVVLYHPVHERVNTVISDYARYELLLKPVMRKGEICSPPPALKDVRANTLRSLSMLDETHKRFINPHVYKVSLSDSLKDLKFSLARLHER